MVKKKSNLRPEMRKGENHLRIEKKNLLGTSKLYQWIKFTRNNLI